MPRNENECKIKGENVYVTWFSVLPIMSTEQKTLRLKKILANCKANIRI